MGNQPSSRPSLGMGCALAAGGCIIGAIVGAILVAVFVLVVPVLKLSIPYPHYAWLLGLVLIPTIVFTIAVPWRFARRLS